MSDKRPQSVTQTTSRGHSTLEINDDRYDRLKLIGWWNQDRLQASRVLVVGAGALGNEVVKNLVLVGVGNLSIVDFDRIEMSNLSRAVFFRDEHCGRPKAIVVAEMARQLNPDCRVVGWPVDVTADIGLGLVREMDVVIGCVDNREARLWINRMCWKVGVPWIDGGIQEISGVAKTYCPPAGACYECTMTENDFRLMHLRYSCPLLKREDLQQGKVPTAPTIASFVGALQAQEALKLIHGREVGSGIGLIFNGDANHFYRTTFPRREDCLAHETYDDVISTPLTSSSLVRDVFEWTEQRLGLVADSLELDRDFLIEFRCENCHQSAAVEQCTNKISHRAAQCPVCLNVRVPQTTNRIERGDRLADYRLSQLGVPTRDIVKIKHSGGVSFIELGGDRNPACSEGPREALAGDSTDGC